MDRVGGAGTRWLVVGDAQAKRCGAVCAEWAGRYCREAVVASWFGWGWPDYRSARRGWLSAADFARRDALLFPVYVSDTIWSRWLRFRSEQSRMCSLAMASPCRP